MPLRPRPRAPREHQHVRAMTQSFLTQPTVPRRISAHLFELAVSAASVIVAIAYVIDPDQALLTSPIGRDLPDYLWISWSALKAVGGLTVIAAIARGRADYRIAGLILLAAGLAMNGVAAMVSSPDVRDLVYLLYATACALRAIGVARLSTGADL